MSNFDPNAILRGAQLTIVGAHRALQNPNVFRHEHYRQAVMAIAIGVLIQGLLQIPIVMARFAIWGSSFFVNLEAAKWDDEVIDILNFLQHGLLQVPFFLMNLLKYITPALDNMFMESLAWVDKTYTQKHASEDPSTLRSMYHSNLVEYISSDPSSPSSKAHKKTPWHGLEYFLLRYGRKAAISLTIYLLSEIPVVGKLVLPVVSFYTFDNAVGPKPAVVIFASGLFVRKRYLIYFLQTYFASRSLMRELLEPYFTRIHFTPAQKKAWYHDRTGVLFGFGVGFFLLVKIPIIGVLVYGIAEASTAYLITKITDPPPAPTETEAEKIQWVQGQTVWKNKKAFMEMTVGQLDGLNVEKHKGNAKEGSRSGRGSVELQGKKFS